MSDLVRKATAKLRESIETAERHFKRRFVLHEFTFDLKGSSAGQMRYRADRYTIRINRVLLEQDPRHVIDQTVPHEVAHLVARQVYGLGIQSHGEEWSSIMQNVFGLQPDRCHHIDTSTASPRPYVYACKCIKHYRLSKRMHLAHMRKRKRYCKLCTATLVFSHEEKLAKEEQSISHLLVVNRGQPFGAQHAKVIKDLVKGFRVGQVTLRMDGDLPSGTKRLMNALQLDEALISSEAIGASLPGAVSHAVFFALPGDERILSAAERLRERNSVVRVLRHPDA